MSNELANTHCKLGQPGGDDMDLYELADWAGGILWDALEALSLLYDHQNGCPLPSYEKGWGDAMKKAEAVLKEAGR